MYNFVGITTKTNWTKDDYFNPEDYNRIKNNITMLKTISLELYPDFALVGMGLDETYSGLPYADLINALENNLDTISTNTVKADIGQKKLFSDYSRFIDYVELNRLETACLTLYNLFYGQYGGRNKLKFKLGTKGVVR